ncbi:hypothetical protein PR048_015778 [Dryococelus australis]|uniref:Uncharacterized protein n=1 Tax=Dryococelus australis TaxID=614101 RepID=A0ABQ9HHX9_9NEOP|nr:hypothetical protein PR048_015778 [Dryococelus australis]
MCGDEKQAGPVFGQPHKKSLHSYELAIAASLMSAKPVQCLAARVSGFGFVSDWLPHAAKVFLLAGLPGGELQADSMSSARKGDGALSKPTPYTFLRLRSKCARYLQRCWQESSPVTEQGLWLQRTSHEHSTCRTWQFFGTTRDLRLDGVPTEQKTCLSIPEVQLPIIQITNLNSSQGAVVAERLDGSPPTKKNRAQSPAGLLPDLLKWKSCGSIPLVGGLSRGSLISSSLALKTLLLRAAQNSLSTAQFFPRGDIIQLIVWPNISYLSKVFLPQEDSDRVEEAPTVAGGGRQGRCVRARGQRTPPSTPGIRVPGSAPDARPSSVRRSGRTRRRPSPAKKKKKKKLARPCLPARSSSASAIRRNNRSMSPARPVGNNTL